MGVVGGLDWSTYVTHTLTHPGRRSFPWVCGSPSGHLMSSSLLFFYVHKNKFSIGSSVFLAEISAAENGV